MSDTEEIKEKLNTLTGFVLEDRDKLTTLTDLVLEDRQKLTTLTDLFLGEQQLNQSRHEELRGAISGIESQMITRNEFEAAFSALSEDISAVVTDHVRLKKRVDVLWKVRARQ